MTKGASTEHAEQHAVFVAQTRTGMPRSSTAADVDSTIVDEGQTRGSESS
jgi:hypothetical protein